MNGLRIMSGGAVLALLAACSSGTSPDHGAAASGPAAASTAIPASNPLKPLLDTRQRAQDVQKVLKAHDDAERKALKQAQQ